MRLTQQQALAKLQATIAEILDVIALFCAEHDLTWFLDSGTALGALRHDGFIPWDDDADIGLLRPDWDRFVAIARDEGIAPGYSVHTPHDTPKLDATLAKVFKDGTRFIDRRARDGGFDQAIFVDVFAYDPLMANPKARRRQLRGARFWSYVRYLQGSADNIVPHRGALGAAERMACRVAHPLANALFSREQVLANYERSIPAPSDEVSDIYTPLPYLRPHPKATLLPTRLHAFEGRQFPVPADADDYLSVRYGDWHQLPAPEERKSHLPVLIDFGDGDCYEA